MFSVDLDTTSVRRLLLVLKSALSMDLKIKKIEISPSKRGFHLILEGEKNEIDGIMKRALLWDDGRRIRYSLKRLALNGEPEIVFERKGGKNSIDITKNFDFKEIEEKDVDELVEKYEKIINPFQKKVWITAIGIPEDMKGIFEDICSDIAEKDKTFSYRIYESYFPKYDFIVVIFSSNKDQAFQRGEWFKRTIKTDYGIDILYWVKKKIGK